ncbi:MAG: esterase-like activity of phytase family protein [Burkholderiales bacterium]|nr:esterase-like activity of phytase family protein [Burkholderiales bacterium]
MQALFAASPVRAKTPNPIFRLARSASLALCVAAMFASGAQAAPGLLAIGTLNGSSDLSGLTGPLENGLAGNVLGGMGSGMAWAGGNTFATLPDRGPNAAPYNAAVDNTASYISRFQTVNMTLAPSSSGSGLPMILTPVLTQTTLLSSSQPLVYGSGAGINLGTGAPASNTASTFYFSGRSDNFGGSNSGNALNGRFDPEAIRVSADGRSVFISDEYGPYVRQFDRTTGVLIRNFELPAKYYAPNQNAVGDTEISGNTIGRVSNKGMEGLAITPDGKTIVGIVQAPMAQDAAISASNKLLRIIAIDVATGAIKGEYGYKLTTGSGVSEITAINDHEFLVLERDGKGLGDGTNAAVKTLFKIDLTGATDISTLSGSAAANAAVAKTSFLDIVAVLGANGITKANVPAKLEALAFGADILVNGTLTHTLWMANDNDFLPTVAGTNNFYVFGVTDADLGASQYVGQSIPVPSTLALTLLALAGLPAVRRLRQTKG